MPPRPLTLAALVLAAGLAACGSEDGSALDSSSPSAAEPAPSGPTTACAYPDDGREPARDVEPPSTQAPSTGKVTGTLRTNQGDVAATLDAEAAPCTVHSFVSLAEQGYFHDTPCHRLTTQGIFVLQCGDPSGTGMQGPGYSFDDELAGAETYGPGTIAMANAGPDTNGSQFFLVYRDTELPPNYTVFGRIDRRGLDVVRDVAEAGVQGGGPDGPPAAGVLIESVTVDRSRAPAQSPASR